VRDCAKGVWIFSASSGMKSGLPTPTLKPGCSDGQGFFRHFGRSFSFLSIKNFKLCGGS
jgi:hypothetical protein